MIIVRIHNSNVNILDWRLLGWRRYLSVFHRLFDKCIHVIRYSY